MNRRVLLAQAGAGLAGLGLTTTAWAQAKTTTKKTPMQDVLATTAECLAQGELCIAHCADMFAAGDTSMAACNKSVQDMLATCQAMLKLASHDSDIAAQMADACIMACEICQKECEKHSKMEVCKACSESCKRCAAACRKAFRKV